jgi:hypothetical protein
MPQMRTIRVTQEVYEALMQLRGPKTKNRCKAVNDKLHRFIPDAEDEFAEDERQFAGYDEYNDEED